MTYKTLRRRFLLLSAAILLAACGRDSDSDATGQDETGQNETVAPEATSTTPDLATLLASDSRSEEDRVRDAGRRPADVIEFLGIEPGMRVVDVIGAGGYYTEVISLAVGPDGQVAALNPAVIFQLRDGAMGRELETRLANNRLPNVTQLNKEIADLTPDDGPFDAAFTALNLHDIYNRGGSEGAIQAMAAISQLLKPGAVFGVIDHDGSAENDNVALHRMQLSDAIRVAESAGFIVESSSGLLHVHSDDLSENVFAEGTRGNTHRFLLKLRKPEA